jgi:plasmid stability protein
MLQNMAGITIRNLDEATKRGLRLRAARHGRSLEDEARHILRATLASERHQTPNLFAAIRSHIAPFGGVTLDLPRRRPLRNPPRLDE